MLHFSPNQLSTPELHAYLLGSVAPRPICFASTLDSDGNVNLAPYSFFNVFSANPPIMIFSPARRVRGNTTKHTLENILETKEVVINIVSFEMVQQMSLASTEYPKGVNEFEKAGFTQIASEKVKPPRVAEAPVQFECKVNDVVALGEEGGAGNLIIAEVVYLHIQKKILDKDGKIDPMRIDTVARMGGNWYSRAKAGVFEVEKPNRNLGIGVDALPKAIRESNILTGNDLGRLANVDSLPKAAKKFVNSSEEVHRQARQFLERGNVKDAWNILTKENK